MKIQPLTEDLGAEATGIDLMRNQNELADPLRSALIDRGVLVVRDQRVDAKQFVEIARGFGPIEPYESTVKQFLMPDHPEIIMLSNMMRDGKPLGLSDAGQYWHTDRSYVEEPAWSSMLHAIKLPIDEFGVTHGNTQFTSSIAAFAALPNVMKAQLRKLNAVHRYIYRYTKAPQNPLPPVEHPVVLKHPYNGQECLYVNSGFTSHIVGMSEQKSQVLLKALYAHLAQPQFVYTHQWRTGDVLLWDNFATQHNAVADYQLPLERLMWRTTIRKPHNIAIP